MLLISLSTLIPSISSSIYNIKEEIVLSIIISEPNEISGTTIMQFGLQISCILETLMALFNVHIKGVYSTS